jgi:hypothetical protein
VGARHRERAHARESACEPERARLRVGEGRAILSTHQPHQRLTCRCCDGTAFLCGTVHEQQRVESATLLKAVAWQQQQHECEVGTRRGTNPHNARAYATCRLAAGSHSCTIYPYPACGKPRQRHTQPQEQRASVSATWRWTVARWRALAAASVGPQQTRAPSHRRLATRAATVGGTQRRPHARGGWPAMLTVPTSSGCAWRACCARRRGFDTPPC